MISTIFARSGGPPAAALTTSAASRKNSGPIAAGVIHRRILRDLNAAYQYLNSNAVVRKDDVAVMGYCWGGQRSFLYAATVRFAS